MPDLFWSFADGTGTPERLLTGLNAPIAKGMVPDGQSVVIIGPGPKGDNDLFRVFLNGPPRTEPLVHTAASETNADISPDGHWMAYQSNESGQYEVYVRPFPNVDQGRWQISSGGGTLPVWARNGRELFYTDQDGFLVSVAVQTASTFSAGRPVKVSDNRNVIGAHPYDISPDGQRFLMVKVGGGTDQTAAPPQLIIVQNWQEELKRLVPTK
jgi:Tol biopolymer transport system component